MSEEAGQQKKRRGPAPNPDRGKPSGYRVTARRRFELSMAAIFVGTSSLQDTIDLAVTEFLERMGDEPGFREALTAAERSQRRRAGVGELRRPDL